MRITTTRAAIVRAFRQWLNEERVNPSAFLGQEEIAAMGLDALAERSADHLIARLPAAEKTGAA